MICSTNIVSTLTLCFRNPAMFERNVKITKGEACQLMIDSTQNLQKVCDVFKKYTREIRRKNIPQDPNFFKISLACSKIEQFIEGLFPSVDVKAIVAKADLDNKLKRLDGTSTGTTSEATNETFYMFTAVFAVCIVVTIFMVCPLNIHPWLSLTFAGWRCSTSWCTLRYCLRQFQKGFHAAIFPS